ncbi:sugar ABC transporter permease [Verminephrobacter aporrectodeae subsp. tuberculatae]|uniref:Sugar ABC transporter permease n=1 Tax=Verminephrobacter aporrectodeae subsp. tuberculatae TaxID=1110392 RepID=A0ABT3KXM1_9BURK|nr:sugar ABC transporter permease [Verminephrobacter aporrectodeae]MCW5258636.1 sugar ABC transporter permease [Verminephrobacter aporrectodeae subsp. tuberculatae]MCW5323084.1 sugar ABC transporter permease [Verminephrobacter aporrectodeae subsp. tuberculatae]
MSATALSAAAAAAASTRHRSPGARAGAHWSNALFIAPFLVVYGLLLVVPLAKGLWISLQEVDMLSHSAEFVGLRNYHELWADAIFRTAVRNTFAFVLMSTPVFVALGLALALALNRPGRAAATLRAIFFGSSVLSVTIVTLVWKLVLMPHQGLLANMTHALGLPSVSLLTSETWALPMIVVVTVWWIIGLPMMLFLAALQQIPHEVYEAAALDSASRWRTLRHVTLPAIRRTVALVAIVEVILQFQMFGQAHLMTQGGPNDSSRPIVQFIYEAGFQHWTLGYAAAASQVLFAIMLIAMAAQVWARHKEAQ